MGGDKCPDVELTIVPRTSDIGNFEVRRALPSKERRMVGPFIFWDQMGPGEFLTGQGLDVRPHPHIGLATLTYLFDGEIMHRDSLGSVQLIKPGDVNLMTAGSGITHSERTDEDARAHNNHLFGIQSWIALPKDKEETGAAFMHHGKASLPVLEDEGKKVRLVAGSLYGMHAPVEVYSDTVYADIVLNAGAKLPVPAEIEERALYAVHGRIEIGGTVYDPGQLLILRPGDEVTVTALEDARIMLLGGAAMDGERHIWWNFVSSWRERIEQAMEDWREGRFASVPGDPEFIPLPQ